MIAGILISQRMGRCTRTLTSKDARLDDQPHELYDHDVRRAQPRPVAHELRCDAISVCSPLGPDTSRSPDHERT